MSDEIETVQVVIESLKAAGVRYVFGVPGAKIDSLFNAIIDHPDIHLVVCRHEQNAAFIAAAVGKLTGIPGVCIATSGPGTSNLVTGLVTANDEGSPLVALVGSVKRSQSAKRTHQSLQSVDLLRPVTKKISSVIVPDQVAEIMVDAFRVAAGHPKGATAVNLPIDVMTTGVRTAIHAFPSTAFKPPETGPAPKELLKHACSMIERANFPVLFLGARAADVPVVEAVHEFLRAHPLPVIETFQAAGGISKELVHLFFGRVGLFRNQPGDKLLTHADLVITVGYDQAEYDANQWNPRNNFDILHLDCVPADLGHHYHPKLELVGAIPATIVHLTSSLRRVAQPQNTAAAKALSKELHAWQHSAHASPSETPGLVHPLYFIRLLREQLSPSLTVVSDVGSVYIWLSRYFYSYKPKTFLVSNVQQTLGVALPWAIGASLAQHPEPCKHKVVSISGDGGFLFSGQELVTAVKEGCDITQFIWNDGRYNMVEVQEVAKYGRSAGVELGDVDFVEYAKAFGARGWTVTEAGEMEGVMKEALAYRGVAVVDVQIDYTENAELMGHVIADAVA